MELEEILKGIDGLAFVDSSVKEGLLGNIMNMQDAAHRKTAINAFVRKVHTPLVASGAMTSRDLAKQHISDLPKEVIQGLHSRKLQLVDVVFRVTKVVASGKTTIDIFKGDDVLDDGKSNVSGAKLDKDNHVLITDISLLSGIEGTGDVTKASYGIADKTILNGEFDFTSGNADIVQKKSSCTMFDTTNRTDVQRGTHRLHSPKWMKPQETLAMQVRLSNTAPDNTCVQFLMFGQAVVKA